MKNSWKEYWDNCSEDNSKNPQIAVQRTKNKSPISANNWLKLHKFVFKNLNLKQDDILLDFCCGNGVFSIEAAKIVDRVIAVDYATKFIEKINSMHKENIFTINKDGNNFNFAKNHYTKILFYAGIQYFDKQELTNILQRIYAASNKGTIIYIGDIPNVHLIWKFYNTKTRKSLYFEKIKRGEDIIGNWYDEQWLHNLVKYLGFRKVRFLAQPEYQINHHFRFDMVLEK